MDIYRQLSLLEWCSAVRMGEVQNATLAVVPPNYIPEKIPIPFFNWLRQIIRYPKLQIGYTILVPYGISCPTRKDSPIPENLYDYDYNVSSRYTSPPRDLSHLFLHAHSSQNKFCIAFGELLLPWNVCQATGELRYWTNAPPHPIYLFLHYPNLHLFCN